VARLQREFVAAIRSPQVHETLVAQGLQPQTSTSAEFARFLHAQIAKWTDVARKANLKPE
jgi:tripartite-type tricarboxylate transporter receptor subunit TctC